MPTPPNQPLICRVAMLYDRAGREEVNTFFAYKASGWTVSDMTDLANVFGAWWTGEWRGSNGPWVSLVQVQVRLLDPANPLAVDYAVGTAGTAAGTEMPGNVTLAIGKRTFLAGRAYRGRFYIPGLPSAAIDVVNDTILSGYLFNQYIAHENLRNSLIAHGYAEALFHKDDNLFTIVTRTFVDDVLDSQRRRLPNRGR